MTDEMTALQSILVEDYIKRGRAHANSETEALKQAWPDAFRAWVRERTPETNAAEEDIRVELYMRGVEVDMNDAPDAAAVLMAEIRASVPNFEEMAKHPDLERIVKKMAEDPN